jgi:hypothetical protein
VKVLHGKPKPRVERWAALHDDGTMSLAVVARNLPARSRRARREYSLIDLDEVLPLDLVCEGVAGRPRLILKLFVKLKPGAVEKLRWKALAALCKT